MSRLPARLAAVVLAAGLAACAPIVEPPSTTAEPSSPAATREVKIPPPQPRMAALTPPSAEAAPTPKTPDAPAWTPPVPGPKHLLGLDGARVSQLLGPPDFRRQDKPAEIWQYRSADCVLDLFLYGKPGGGARVSHVEIRDLGKPAVSEADCLRALFKDRPRATG